MHRLVSWPLSSLLLVAALGCEKADSSPPPQTAAAVPAPAPTANPNDPVMPKTPSGAACKTSKECPAGNVCVLWFAPTGDKVNPGRCSDEVFSGNGQAVACETDADCQDPRLAQVSDIKTFKGQLACLADAATKARRCSNEKPAPSRGGASATVVCRAQQGTGTVELSVDWGGGGGVGKGTLTNTSAGKPDARGVVVRQWKGLLLIEKPGDASPQGRIGVVEEAPPKKTIQLGDDKAPRLPCQ